MNLKTHLFVSERSISIHSASHVYHEVVPRRKYQGFLSMHPVHWIVIARKSVEPNLKLVISISPTPRTQPITLPKNKRSPSSTPRPSTLTYPSVPTHS